MKSAEENKKMTKQSKNYTSSVFTAKKSPIDVNVKPTPPIRVEESTVNVDSDETSSSDSTDN